MMENEITRKSRLRNQKPREVGKVENILSRGGVNYLVELHRLGRLMGNVEVGEEHPTEYLIRVNQWV